jgi:hypothetical protein
MMSRVSATAAAGAAAVLVMLGAAGCDRSEGEPEESVAKPSVALTATFAASASALTIDYRVVSTDRAAVVLFTGVPKTDTPQHPKSDPDAVYVTASGDTVELSKRLFAPPDGVDVNAYFTLRGTVLAPGATFTEHITVPLPLHARRPYFSAMDPPPTLPAEVRTVRFCVGAALQDKVHPVPAESGPDGGPVYAHNPIYEKAQRVVCSAVYQLPGG